MEKNKGTYIEIDKKLIKEIKAYTELNKMQLTAFINELLQKAFMVEKYGDVPLPFKKKKEVPPQPETVQPEEPVVENKDIVQEKPKQIKGKKIITY